jgi:hypothetical protein
MLIGHDDEQILRLHFRFALLSAGPKSHSSVLPLTDDSQIGADLRVCADEEDPTDFDQRS